MTIIISHLTHVVFSLLSLSLFRIHGDDDSKDTFYCLA